VIFDCNFGFVGDWLGHGVLSFVASCADISKSARYLLTWIKCKRSFVVTPRAGRLKDLLGNESRWCLRRRPVNSDD
jgi:hypothetical protein